LIIFIDESGLTQVPKVVRTWAPIGQTPVLVHRGSWKKISCIGAVSKNDFYFQIVTGAATQHEIIAFLEYLLRVKRQDLLIVWDRINIHKSALVKEFLEGLGGRIITEHLPPYAPELNPVEYLWGRWKRYALPNFCPENFDELQVQSKRSLSRLKRRRDSIVQAFWRQAHLPI